MRVLFILEDLGSSGVTTVTKLIANNLDQMGIDIKILLLRGKATKNKLLDISCFDEINNNYFRSSNNENEIKFDFFKKIFKYFFGRFFFLFFSAPRIKEYKGVISDFDYIYICDLYSKFKFWRIKSDNLKYVVHNIKSKQIQSVGGIGCYLDRYLFNKSLQGRECIAVSNAIKQDLVNNFKIDKKNIKVIHNPFHFCFSKNFNEENEDFFHNNYLLFIGRLSKQKRLDKLILSFYQFRNFSRENNIPELVIIGAGPEKKRLKMLVNKLNLNGSVYFLGHKKYVSNYISKCQALVLTSDYEGFPTVVIEALYFKKYVLSVPIPAMIEMSNYFEGILLSPNNSIFSFSELLFEFNNLQLTSHGSSCLHPEKFNLVNVSKAYVND